MKIKLTYVITVTHDAETDDAGYTNKDDLASCVAEEEEWFNDGSLYLEDMDFSGAVITVTGVLDETDT